MYNYVFGHLMISSYEFVFTLGIGTSENWDQSKGRQYQRETGAIRSVFVAVASSSGAS